MIQIKNNLYDQFFKCTKDQMIKPAATKAKIIVVPTRNVKATKQHVIRDFFCAADIFPFLISSCT